MDREGQISIEAGSRGHLAWLVAGLVALTILAAIILTAQQIAFERRQATDTLIRDNQARVFSFEQFVLRTLEAADLATQQLATSVVAGEPGLTMREAPRLDQLPLFEGVAIQRPHRPFASSLPEPSQKALAAALNAAVQGRDGNLIVTRPISILPDRKLLAIVRKVATSGGEGYVAVLLDPRRFTDFAADVPFQPDDLISLIGLDGVTRARRTGDIFSSGEDVSGTLVMRRQLAFPDGTYLGPSVLDGVVRYFSHRRLERYELFATSGMATSIIDDAVSARRDFLLIILASFVLLVLAASTAVLTGAERHRRQMKAILAANVRLNEAQKIGGMGDWDYFPNEDRLHWSQNLRAMYGRRDDEDVSKISDIQRYLRPADAERVSGEIDRVMHLGETRVYELDVRMPDGSKSMRRVVAAPLRDGSGEIVGIHGTDQDITKDVQLRDAQAKLHEIARMDSMNALAATMAHELNQPLSVASNYLSAAARYARDEGSIEKVRKLILDAMKQIMHLAQMIAAARDIVSHSSSSLTVVPTRDVFDMVIPLLRSMPAGRAAAIDVDIASDAQLVFCNSAQLKQVLFNLGKNGLEAVSTGIPAQLRFTVRRSHDEGVRFDVHDNGEGIGLDDPFAAMSSTKASGMGLGLSLARTIVEAHDGRIWIEKTGPEGTTVSFELPAEEGEGLVRPRLQQ